MKVFISYSYDSTAHADRVLALSDALRRDGIDATIDRYVPAPPEGWPRWMACQIDESGFVVMICTETYKRRVMGRERPGVGRGANWEGNLILNRIYGDPNAGAKFIPVLLPPASPENIPDPAQGYSYYEIADSTLDDPGYEGLVRRLTNQPETYRPELGRPSPLPSRPRYGTSRFSAWPNPELGGGAWVALGALLLTAPLMGLGFSPPGTFSVVLAYPVVIAAFALAFVLFRGQGSDDAATRRGLLAGAVLLLASVALYVGLYLNTVVDLPPRIVTGSAYTPLGQAYRDGFRTSEGRDPSDVEILRDLLESQASAGLSPQAAARLIWTGPSIDRAGWSLRGLWLAILGAFAFSVTSVFLALPDWTRRRANTGPAPEPGPAEAGAPTTTATPEGPDAPAPRSPRV